MTIQERIQFIEALSKALNSLEKVNYITDNDADIKFVSANLLFTISTFETEIIDLSEDDDLTINFIDNNDDLDEEDDIGEDEEEKIIGKTKLFLSKNKLIKND